MTRTMMIAGLLVAAAAAQAGTADEPTAAEKAAIFKAAGFKAKGDKFVRCEDDTSASYMAGFLEWNDLNGDGAKEAFVRESSSFCYGATAEAFVLVARNAKGEWTVLLDQMGMSLVLETKAKNGWKDIEVGGPGAGPFPKFRYDGNKYVVKR